MTVLPYAWPVNRVGIGDLGSVFVAFLRWIVPVILNVAVCVCGRDEVLHDGTPTVVFERIDVLVSRMHVARMKQNDPFFVHENEVCVPVLPVSFFLDTGEKRRQQLL